MVFKIFTATGLIELAEIWLLENPSDAGSVTLLHAASAEKSPVTVAGVGIKAVFCAGSERKSVRWYPPKKNSLSLRTGPPTVPPYWLRFNVSRLVAKASR